MHTESIFVRARSHILSYLQEVALDLEYENPLLVPADCDVLLPTTERSWEELPEGEKPIVIKTNPDELEEDIRQIKRWKQFEETGKAPETDSERETEERETKKMKTKEMETEEMETEP